MLPCLESYRIAYPLLRLGLNGGARSVLVTQVGVAEMKDCVLTTGGLTVQTDTFHNVVFRCVRAVLQPWT